VGAGTPGSGGALSAPRPASPLAASSGTLRLGADTRFAIEFQDDQLTVFYLLEFVNPGQTALAPTPVVIELPTAATGASFMQGAPQGAGIAGSRVTIPGPFAPGVTQVPIAFRIESWPVDWTLDQRFPLPLDNIAVAAQKLTGMTLESPQAATVRETTFQGLPYLVAIGKGVAAGTPLTVTLRGLPHRSPIALYVALLVAVGLVVWGVWAARSRQRPEEATRRRQLESRRHRGLSTLAALDEQARAGTIDAQVHADKRAALLHELERIYRELDAMGDLPGGDPGLAA